MCTLHVANHNGSPLCLPAVPNIQVKIAIQLQEMRQGLKADTDRSTQSLGIAQMDFIPGKPTKPTA